MQLLEPNPDPPESKPLGWGPSHVGFKQGLGVVLRLGGGLQHQ